MHIHKMNMHFLFKSRPLGAIYLAISVYIKNESVLLPKINALVSKKG